MMQLNGKKEWFATWFNSRYYHILYKSRDDQEARKFIESLCNWMKIPAESQLLDLACGAGRHSRVLNELGYQVSGCDLSENSIKEAIENSPSNMRFFVHDMRNELPGKYDVILNLFTSFGYFEDVCENLKVLKSANNALNENGRLVIDFMNSSKIIRNMQPVYDLEIEGIKFHIEKKVVDGKILKSINFEDEGVEHVYEEKVQALTYSDFDSLISEAGFDLTHCFGSYALEPYDEMNSDRLILICTKQS